MRNLLCSDLGFEVIDKKSIPHIDIWGHRNFLVEVTDTFLALRSMRVEWLGELRVVYGSSNIVWEGENIVEFSML